mmetsp:Transcript_10518/g.30876  ORF Transcript_10518/g.30876 Transcript_10518/m.30876 type:complete len:313 (+) Transcript_10518:113-1051(+)
MGEPLKIRVRDGCRGGSEQFTWGSLKDQQFKDRECYLGQSTKIGMMGKFGRYYVHDWFGKKRQGVETIEEERSAVKAYEEELMQEALGMKPKKLLLAKTQLTEDEMKDLLTRDENKNADKQGRTEMGPQKKVLRDDQGREVVTSNEEIVAVAAREAMIQGVGFAGHRNARLEEIKAKTTGTVGTLMGSALSNVKIEIKDEDVKYEASSSSLGPKIKGEPDVKQDPEVKEEPAQPSPSRHRGTESEERRWRKAVKKEEKEAKKEKKRRKAEKKLRKAEKKLKKHMAKEQSARDAERDAKRRKASSGSSSSSSS